MVRITTIIGIIIVAVFLYYLLTNPTFLSYVESSLKIANSTINSAEVQQLINATKGMNEGTFLNWSQTSGSSNPIIQKVISVSGNSTTLKSNLETIYNSMKPGAAALEAVLNSIISKSKS